MALTTICKNTSNLTSFIYKGVLSAFGVHRNVPPLIYRSYQSTSLPDRRLQTATSSASGSCLNGYVRHAHTRFDFEKYDFPKKKIAWRHRFMLRWKMASKFDTEEFFTDVIDSFLYTTKCIARGHIESLESRLTDEAMEAIPDYVIDAESENRKIYIVAKDDLSMVRVTRIGFKQAAEFQGVSDVTVLSTVVWIAYMKNFRQDLQRLECNKPRSQAAWGDLNKIAFEVHDMIHDRCHHAEFTFQRAYDEQLRYAMTDWIIAHVKFNLPTPTGGIMNEKESEV